MFIKSIEVLNYRLFSNSFLLENINTPDGINNGSGLTVLVGENGCGKTSLLEAMALPILSYRTDNFSVHDFNTINNSVSITIYSEDEFDVYKASPQGEFKAKGFTLEGKLREQSNRAYFASIVIADPKFIKADSEQRRVNQTDLRVKVDNPFRGSRFKDSDVHFIDKSKIYQTKSSNYNKNRFDRLMEDFGYQYIKGEAYNPSDLSATVKNNTDTHIENEFLNNAIERFYELTNTDVNLEIIDNFEPYKNAFFAIKGNNNLQFQLEALGSGYEMIFSLLYIFEFVKQSDRKLILLIDEPELHLHPKLQEIFVNKVLMELSKEAQIILATQSPLFVKHISKHEYARTEILYREGEEVKVSEINQYALPTASANEVNYLAFNYATPEYHNELYGHLQETKQIYGISGFDNELRTNENITETRPYINKQTRQPMSPDPTLCTYIRNQIHHPENDLNPKHTDEELERSINYLRSCLL